MYDSSCTIKPVNLLKEASSSVLSEAGASAPAAPSDTLLCCVTIFILKSLWPSRSRHVLSFLLETRSLTSSLAPPLLLVPRRRRTYPLAWSSAARLSGDFLAGLEPESHFLAGLEHVLSSCPLKCLKKKTKMSETSKDLNYLPSVKCHHLLNSVLEL